jgi:hypothetical protein
MRLGAAIVVMMVLLGSAGDAQTRPGPSIRGVWTMSEKTTAEGANKAPQPARVGAAVGARLTCTALAVGK